MRRRHHSASSSVPSMRIIPGIWVTKTTSANHRCSCRHITLILRAARKSIAKHAAEVELLDQQVGDTAAMLADLKLTDNTVLIVLSEQGIAMPRGKWSPYDYGSRALCLAHWPGKIPPRRTNAIGMYCDIVPTLIDLAGGEDAKLDGNSMKPLWFGETDTFRDYAFISNVHPFWQKAIVTSEYKLIWSPDQENEHIWSNFTSPSKFFSKPWAEWLARAQENSADAINVQRVLHPEELELYRIDKDPYEVDNLARASREPGASPQPLCSAQIRHDGSRRIGGAGSDTDNAWEEEAV